jgi:hypothetical protein
VATNPKHHLPAPVPHPEPTGGDPRRGTPPPPRGQPPSQPSPAKLSLPLESPASARAKPASQPSPAKSSFSGGRLFSLARPVRHAVWPRRRFLPPPFAGKWAHSNAVTLAAAPSPPRSWAAAGPKALQRARSRLGWAKSRVPSPGKRNSLFFFFFHPFFPFK